MYLTVIRAGMFGMLLAMSVMNSLSANSQTLFPPEHDTSKVPKAESVKKTSFAFKASELYLAGGTVFDMTTTVQGLDHPTTAYRSDNIFLTHYYPVESGWAGCFGNRDAFTAVGANVVLNVGVDLVSRSLYARGGRWRALAFGALLLKGTFNVIAASNNIRNDERINADVRLATGYRGQIIWSH
jgi:hypothetical protein